MGYLINNDFYKQIQEANLLQIINNDQSFLDKAALAAVAELRSYLLQKYNVDAELTNTDVWSNVTIYTAGQRVYLDATAFSITLTYVVGTLVLQAGNVYKCTTAVTVAGAFNLANWTLIGAQYKLFYVSLPKPLFNYTNVYAVGDQVFWKGKTYTCAIATSFLSHEAELQAGVIYPNKIVNVFPDSIASGAQYWGVGVAYSVAAGTLPTDATKWTAGDNRDQKLLMIAIDICLYHLHARIAPQNVPQLRVYRYIGNPEDRAVSVKKVTYPTYSALGWLQAAAEGDDITPALEKIQPNSGMRIRYGGVPKSINNY